MHAAAVGHAKNMMSRKSDHVCCHICLKDLMHSCLQAHCQSVSRHAASVGQTKREMSSTSDRVCLPSCCYAWYRNQPCHMVIQPGSCGDLLDMTNECRLSEPRGEGIRDTACGSQGRRQETACTQRTVGAKTNKCMNARTEGLCLQGGTIPCSMHANKIESTWQALNQ